MFEKIVTAIDGSEYDRKALEATKELSKLAEATVRVVHVREGDFIARAGVVPREEHDGASKLLDGTVDELLAAGVKATGSLRSSVSSLVALEILREAEEYGASVIVKGSRGVSDLKGLIVGSTTHKVLHLGNLPVLVIR
jgi:nucleotide-binding universal stress UspA family protein